MTECIHCTVGYPRMVARQAGHGDPPCTLKGIRLLKRNDGRKDMPTTIGEHKTPNRRIIGEDTLHCRECPKRCGKKAIYIEGISLCNEHRNYHRMNVFETARWKKDHSVTILCQQPHPQGVRLEKASG